MRFELEAFVNMGLREGWCGWPLKEESGMNQTLSLPLHAVSVRFWRRRDNGVTVPDRRLGAFRAGCRCCVEN
jgi:hypothetical protein